MRKLGGGGRGRLVVGISEGGWETMGFFECYD